MRGFGSTLLFTSVFCWAAPALAESILDPSTLSGVVVAGPVATSSEQSWTDGGYGKLEHDDAAVDLDGVIAWRPRLSEDLLLHASLAIEDSFEEGFGLDEAYLKLRRDPSAAIGFSARAGLFFPPASREHDGTEWTTRYTITPSAIGSWIAEEVKVVAIEGTVHVPVGEYSLNMTAAVFGANDTAATLLAFRGWALHTVRATAWQTLPLPPVPEMFEGIQSLRTRPVDEVDGRLGWYVRADTKVTSSLKLGGLVYINNGDSESLINGQYSWDTRFATVDAHWIIDDNTELVAQALVGDTLMGDLVDGVRPINVDYYSAYLLLARYFGQDSLAGRIEFFAVDDNTFVIEDNNNEHGGAFTLAWNKPLSHQLEFVSEIASVWSDRPSRQRLNQDPQQLGVSGRLAVRLQF